MAWLKGRRIHVLKYVVVTFLYYSSLCLAECPRSVMEGSSTTLYCDWSHRPYNNIRKVSWRVTAPDQTTTTVSFCENVTSDHAFPCTNTQPDLYKIARHIPTSRTQLTILNISSEVRNAEFSCVVQNNNAEYVVQSCSMSSVYSVPEDVKCEAYRVGNSAIKVSCHAERVYPGMRCELLPPPSPFTPMEYVNEHSENNPKYYSVACSTTVEIAALGEYNYSVKITPSADDVSRSAVRIYQTNLVAIDISPSVVLQPIGTIRMCPDAANTYLFTCDGFDLPSDTTFRWYIDREEIDATHNNVTTNIKGVGNGDPLNNTFESRFIWEPDMLHNRIRVTCKACFRKMDINQHCVEDMQQVEIIRPPKDPPDFMLNNEPYRDAMYELPVSENSSFQCVVNGGKPEVLSVSVTCDNPYQSFHSNKPYVSFSLEASAMLNMNRTCKCSAEHTTGCYNASAEVVFVIFPHSPRPNVSRSVAGSDPDVAEGSSIVCYIALSFGVLFILIILLAVALYCLPCWEKPLSGCFNYTLLKPNGNNHKYGGSSDDSSQQTSSEDFTDSQQEGYIPLNDLSGKGPEKSFENIYSVIGPTQVTKESPKNVRKVSRSNTLSLQSSSPKMTSTYGNTDANQSIHSSGSCCLHLDHTDTYTIPYLLNPTLPLNLQPLREPSEYIMPDSGSTLKTYVKISAHEAPVEDGHAEMDHHVVRTNDDEHTFLKTFSDSSKPSPGNEYHNFSRLAGRRETNNSIYNNNNSKMSNNIHHLLSPSVLATSRNSSVDKLSMLAFLGDIDPEQGY